MPMQLIYKNYRPNFATVLIAAKSCAGQLAGISLFVPIIEQENRL
jgi:hypothetical protein